jgi:hypothetical protein
VSDTIEDTLATSADDVAESEGDGNDAVGATTEGAGQRPRGRRPRAERPPGAAPRQEVPDAEARGIQPHDYEAHLEREHGLRVVVEPGWPTEIARHRLVKPAPGGREERSLVAYIGTRPAAVDFFSRYLHPAGQKRKAPRGRRRAA